MSEINGADRSNQDKAAPPAVVRSMLPRANGGEVSWCMDNRMVIRIEFTIYDNLVESLVPAAEDFLAFAKERDASRRQTRPTVQPATPEAISTFSKKTRQ